jgi:hypothetical protein
LIQMWSKLFQMGKRYLYQNETIFGAKSFVLFFLKITSHIIII